MSLIITITQIRRLIDNSLEKTVIDMCVRNFTPAQINNLIYFLGTIGSLNNVQENQVGVSVQVDRGFETIYPYRPPVDVHNIVPSAPAPLMRMRANCNMQCDFSNEGIFARCCGLIARLCDFQDIEDVDEDGFDFL